MRCFEIRRFGTMLLFVTGALMAPACADHPIATGPAAESLEPAFGAAVSGPMRISAGVLLTGEVVPPPAPCLQLFNSVIEGTATHLGRFHGVGSTCIVDVIAPDPDPAFMPAGPAPYITASFTNPVWVLTAANGDELWLEGHSAVAVISLADNSLRAAGAHTIIGGTGRFAGATGELESGAVNDDGLGPDDFESSGWIRFDASSRSAR